MPAYEYLTFRARASTEGEFWTVKDFLEKHDLKFSALLNSMLPAMSHCLRNYVRVDKETGKVVVEMNLGEITVE